MRYLLLLLTLLYANLSMAYTWPDKDTVPNILGIHMHLNTSIDYSAPENNAAMNKVRDAKVQYIRIFAPRSDIQRGEVSFEPSTPMGYPPGYTQTLEFIRSKGMKIGYGMGFGSNACTPTYPVDAAGRACFNKYAAFSGMFFRDWPIEYVETWNEPNLYDEFTSATPFVTYQNEMITAFKEGWDWLYDGGNAKPYPAFIGPSVANAWALGNFFDDFLDLGGADQLDLITMHPYADLHPNTSKRKPETLVDSVFQLRTALATKGINKPIGITEFGWSTDTSTTNPGRVDELTQGKYATRTLALCYYSGLQLCGLYSLADARNYPVTEPFKGYGWFSTTGANFAKQLISKPAVDKVRSFNTFFNGYKIVRSNVNLTDNVDSWGRLCLSGACTFDSYGKIETDPGYQNDWALVFHKESTNHTAVAIWTTDTGVTKTTPNLMPLFGLTGTTTTTYTDDVKNKGVTTLWEP